jgi:Ankyrin repeats (3 copies)
MNRLVCLVFGIQLALFAGDNDEALLAAARKGDLASVKELCEKGAAIETKTPYGQTPLYLAALNGHEEVVRFLIEKGANTELKDSFYKASILGFTLERKHFGVAKMLIANGGNPDEQLSEVVDAENADLVETVLAKGKVSQAALDKSYETAIDQKQASMIELLKKAGAHEPAPPFTVDAKVLESYVGTYKTDQLPFDLKAFVKDGKLHLQATGQPEFAPKAKSPTSFEFAQWGLQVDFDSAASFTLKQGGKEFKFKKAVAQ